MKINWVNFFHIYQPPNWSVRIIKKVAKESYRPILSILKRHPNIKITLNISGSLTEQLAENGFKDIIRDIQKLIKRKQIELTGTAMYHPILPLIPTREIIRQIELNTKTNRKYYGKAFNPTGFFPPEMAYGRKVATAISTLGYKWIITDEISRNGTLNTTRFNTNYKIKGTKLSIVFRNRFVSDYFSFHANPNYPEGFWEAVKNDGRSASTVITGMDGENLGHHRKGWDLFWEQLVTSKGVTTLTISEMLKKNKRTKIISPKRASWSAQEREIKNGTPYALWDDPRNPIHQNLWRLIRHVSSRIGQKRTHPNYQQARILFDRRLASDQFWWASAKPWWSLAIIKKKTKELLSIALLLDNDDTLAKQLARHIVRTAHDWQGENKFKTIADRYLASNDDEGVRYIGGKRITNT